MLKNQMGWLGKIGNILVYIIYVKCKRSTLVLQKSKHALKY